jgi:beta-N-acetylhexosaminidase
VNAPSAVVADDMLTVMKRSPSRPTRQLAAITLCLTGVAVVVAPAAASPQATTAGSVSPRALAKAAYAQMTERQRVGQLFMTGVASTGPTTAEIRAVQRSATGSVFLRGDSTQGHKAVRRIVTALAPSATHAQVRPFVGTDQEGGEVQDLQGSGFTRMPTALDQGRLAPSALRTAAAGWAAQLRSSGVNVDLAPVADTVPTSIGRKNQPIGAFDREYGHTVTRVRHHVTSFVRGLDDSHVSAAVKHFPGLGRATGNTDTRHGVTDPTGPHSRFLLAYRDGIDAGAQFVMVSSATYPKIDPHHRACFSPTVIGSLLRGREKFTGIVISDAFDATAVNDLSLAARAQRFFAAGGTMLLDPLSADVPTMARAVRSAVLKDKAFAATIKTDVLKVLTIKARDGLLS